MNVEEIKAIVKLMSDNDLTEFRIAADEYRLCIRRGGRTVEAFQNGTPIPMVAPPVIPAAATAPAAAPIEDAAPAVPAKTIDSPLVGTFYRAPGPDAPPFAKVGDKVTPETVVCIIEAMKVMNEVKAETSGVIKDILVADGIAVEYGQPLFVIE